MQQSPLHTNKVPPQVGRQPWFPLQRATRDSNRNEGTDQHAHGRSVAQLLQTVVVVVVITVYLAQPGRFLAATGYVAPSRNYV